MAKKKKQASNMLEVQNAAKTLFANIRFMSPDNPIRSIVMTSSVPNEGKSTCSVELARAIATSGKTVLLVEADMRHRTLASLLNVRPAAGVYAVLTDAAPLKTAVTPTQTPNLFFLDVEPNIPNPADIISSKRYQKLVATLEDSYDYVIYDMPPVGTFVDAAILSTLVDGTVLVVKPGSTKRSELVDACEGTGSEYYYAYYTKDGSRVKDDGDVSALQAETRTPVPTAGRRAPRGAQGSPVPAGGRGGFAKDPVAGRGRRA